MIIKVVFGVLFVIIGLFMVVSGWLVGGPTDPLTNPVILLMGVALLVHVAWESLTEEPE